MPGAITVVVSEPVYINRVGRSVCIYFEMDGLSFVNTYIGGKTLYGKIACATYFPFR
jgi:hypothetical protein